MLTQEFMKMILNSIDGKLSKGEVEILRKILSKQYSYKIECEADGDVEPSWAIEVGLTTTSYKVCTMDDEWLLKFMYGCDGIVGVKYNFYPLVKNDESFKKFKDYVFSKNLLKCNLYQLSKSLEGRSEYYGVQMDYVYLSDGKFDVFNSSSALGGLTPLTWWEAETNIYLANLYVNLEHFGIDYSTLDDIKDLFIAERCSGYGDLLFLDTDKLNSSIVYRNRDGNDVVSGNDGDVEQ